MKIEKLLLTGGGGLVGSILTPMLKEKYAVTHFDMKPVGDGLPCIEGDLRDRDAVGKACQGMDAVLHIGALHGPAWKQCGDDMGFDVNVTGTKNILEAAAAAGVQRVVFASSIWATGHNAPAAPYLPIDEELPREPAEMYGLTKILCEKMCRYATATNGLSTIVIRPGGIGRPDAYAPDALRYALGMVDVRDVAQACVLALEAPEEMRHEVFIITADSPLCAVDGDAFRRDPLAAVEAALPALAEKVRKGELELNAGMEWYTIEKAKRLLGYEPEYNFQAE
ncbi:MAG: NAD-dependent epimerase/dehydratase family protein [Candidatus Sumerlaeia bacterium]